MVHSAASANTQQKIGPQLINLLIIIIYPFLEMVLFSFLEKKLLMFSQPTEAFVVLAKETTEILWSLEYRSLQNQFMLLKYLWDKNIYDLCVPDMVAHCSSCKVIFKEFKNTLSLFSLNFIRISLKAFWIPHLDGLCQRCQ